MAELADVRTTPLSSVGLVTAAQRALATGTTSMNIARLEDLASALDELNEVVHPDSCIFGFRTLLTYQKMISV
jgi:hypothetical protein